MLPLINSMSFTKIQEAQGLLLNTISMRWQLIYPSLLFLFFFFGECKSQKKMNDAENTRNCENIPILVNNINKNPDMLHLDYTPAVHALSKCGLKALGAILPLLNSKDVWERQRAQRVLEGVVQRRHGWKPGQGFPKDFNGEEKTRDLFHQMGNYRAGSSENERIASIAKWKAWLKAQTD